MATIKETVDAFYKPSLAVIVYSTEGSYYLESHAINEDGSVSNGKPLLQETMQSIVDVFFDERKNRIKVSGHFPENLLNYTELPGGYYEMLWYRPEEIRVMHFAPQLKLSTGKTSVPPMLYQVSRNSLNVFALKGDSRPTEKTALYRAPFHNVSDDGSVCLGNASVKKPNNPSYADLMKYWEDLFWLSEFTHANGSDKVVKGDLHTIWKQMLASKGRKKWADLDVLIKSVNLKKLIDEA